MARTYTVNFSGDITAADTDKDLFELTPASNEPIRIKGFILSQSTEAGDAAAENLRISIIRLPATVTSGNGTSTTPAALDENDPAADFTAETNGATLATTSGTAVTLVEAGWNELNTPYEMWFPDEQCRPRVQNAGAIVLRMHTTVGDTLTFQGTVWVEEL